jgi:copper(I)-binding protein
MVINNSGAEAYALIGATVSADLVEVVELHTVVEEGGVMKMSPVEKIEVPANGEVMLKPGSFHVMMIGVKQELKPGDLVKLSLTFEKAGTVELDAVVRPANPMP